MSYGWTLLNFVLSSAELWLSSVVNLSSGWGLLNSRWALVELWLSSVELQLSSVELSLPNPIHDLKWIPKEPPQPLIWTLCPSWDPKNHKTVLTKAASQATISSCPKIQLNADAQAQLMGCSFCYMIYVDDDVSVLWYVIILWLHLRCWCVWVLWSCCCHIFTKLGYCIIKLLLELTALLCCHVGVLPLHV